MKSLQEIRKRYQIVMSILHYRIMHNRSTGWPDQVESVDHFI
jgi:hypothetical protein